MTQPQAPTLAPSGTRLDAAWERCEAALPPTGRVHLQRRAEAQEISWKDGTWVARQGRAEGKYEAWATDVATMKAVGFTYGDTAAEALTALADLLAAVLPPDPFR